MTIPFSANTTSDRRIFRRHSLSTAGILTLAIAAMPGIAHAQAAPAMMASVEDKAPATGDTATVDSATIDTAQDQSASGEAPGEEITVTGSRIVRDGYDAPTPVSVISSKELQAEAPANIADFVNTLPSVRGSSTAANSNGSLSNGLAGVASVNLRSLGAQRTLVLFDGQRSVAAATSGVVDVNTFPQALVERVEVVTGGASSAYGSDAVSGVINFILDKKYTGVKGSYEYGVTTYSDGPNHKFTLTAGTPFAGGKGHILVSGEYFTQKGIQSIDRDWNDSGFFQIDNPAYSEGACKDALASTICYPARLIQGGIGTGQFTQGGLINSAGVPNTPGGVAATNFFKGIYFGQINPATGKASVNNFVYGPANGQWMVGGDYLIGREGHASSATLLPSEDRKSAFGRVSYEFSPAIEIYGQFAYSRYQGQSYYQQTPTTGVTIQVAPSASNGGLINAYLPTSFVNQVNAYNATPGNVAISTVSIGTSNAGIPPQGSDNTREVFRYVVGASGDFGLLDRDWHWDAYYQKGITKTNELLTNAWNLDRMTLATDAVVAPAGNASGIAAGTIVCRSRLTLANVNNGCVPINRIGVGGITPEALNYIMYDGLQPLRKQTLKQDVAAFNLFTNNLVDIWAGPISLGVGAEWRQESVSGSVDPLFQPRVANGVTNGTWIYGNYLPTFGKYNVKEAYLETIIPLFKGADFNGAFRLTDYSTSGTVSTWKAGVTWQPIPDVKFRGTISRDIRAPNLGELFAPGTGRTNTVNVPVPNGTLINQRVDQFNESTVGNPALRPEVAKTYGVGAIFTPSFIPGLAFSVDYFQIKLSGAIANIGAQTLVTQCYEQSNAAACAAISTTGGRGVTTAGLLITSIELKPTNFVGIEAKGIDFEASYRKPIGPGVLTLRALATKNISLYTDNGVDVPTEAAGQNSGSLPDWNYRVSAGYDVGPWGFQLVGRGVSGGVYDNSYIVCSTDCPVSTVANRTVNRNDIAGAIYVDLQVNHEFEIAGAKTTAFLSIKNLLDTDPVLVGNGPTGNNTPAYPQTNRNLYDVLGRVFRVGVRFDF
ncbi:MAG: TonB-dependent receptor [Sphingomonas sp.]|jgi:outer membrane receptor protein involved in Fe transport|uniref:TonB-dependent receptor plug domain-containing protein n=1 Tax=Sphingomonas sp. TaxID=28214 RepID=UPI003563177A